MTAGLVADALARGAPVQLFPPERHGRDRPSWEALLQQPIAATCLVEDQPLLVALSTRRERVMPVRVLVIDDSALVRNILSRALAAFDEIEIVGAAPGSVSRPATSSSSCSPTSSRWTSSCRTWTASRSCAS